MGDRCRRRELHARPVLERVVQAVEEPLTAAEQDRDDRQVDLVQETSAQVLLHRGGTSAQPDVPVAGSRARPVEGRLDAGVLSSGQAVGVIEDLPTVAELIARIMSEAEDTLKRLQT